MKVPIMQNKSGLQPQWLCALLLVAVALAVWQLPANAETAPDSGNIPPHEMPYFYSAMLSGILPQDSRHTHLGWGGSMGLAKKVSKRLALEGVVFYNHLSNNADSAYDRTQILGAGVHAIGFFFPHVENLYVLGGLDYGRTSHAYGTDHRYNDFMVDLGIGYMFGRYHLGGLPLYIRVQAAYRLDVHHHDRSGTHALGTGRCESTIENGNQGSPCDPGRGASSFSDGIFSLGVVFPLGETDRSDTPY